MGFTELCYKVLITIADSDKEKQLKKALSFEEKYYCNHICNENSFFIQF